MSGRSSRHGGTFFYFIVITIVIGVRGWLATYIRTFKPASLHGSSSLCCSSLGPLTPPLLHQSPVTSLFSVVCLHGFLSCTLHHFGLRVQTRISPSVPFPLSDPVHTLLCCLHIIMLALLFLLSPKRLSRVQLAISAPVTPHRIHYIPVPC